MRRIVSALVLVILVSAVAAPFAHADERVEADGYEFLLPAGFIKVASSDELPQGCVNCPDAAELQNVTTWMMGTPADPQAALVIAVLEMDSDAADMLRRTGFRGGKEPFMEMSNEELGMEMDMRIEDGVLIKGSDMAAEIQMHMVTPMHEVRTRMLYAMNGNDMVMVILTLPGSGEDAEADLAMWEGVRSSLKLTDRNQHQDLLLYGSIAIALITFFVVISVTAKDANMAPPRAYVERVSTTTTPAAGAPVTAGLGVRAMDGLPMYSAANATSGNGGPDFRMPVPGGPEPIETTPARPVSEIAPPPKPAAPEGLRSTTTETPLPTPPAPGGGLKSTLGGGLRSTLEAPGTRPTQSAPAAPADSTVEAEAEKKPRGGLRSTLGPSGRWSQ